MESTFYEDIALEAVDFSNVRKTIIAKIKKALLTIIRILRKLTKTNKDKGIRARIDKLLSKAERKLSDADKINTPEQAEQMKTDVNELQTEVEKVKEDLDGKITHLDKPEPVPNSFKKVDYDPNPKIIKKTENTKTDTNENTDKSNDHMYETFKKMADNHDKKGLVYTFVDSLEVDPTFVKYQKGYSYAKSVYPEWLEEYKELTPLINDPSKWNIDYMVKLKLDFQKNPSEKRFNHMRKVAKVIYKDKIQRLLKERANKK